MIRRRLLFAFAALGSSTAASAQPALPPVVAIENVNVIPMDREVVLRDRTVVVRGGSIAAIGDRRSQALPPRTRRIDGQGGYLIPGLTDAHVHLYYGTTGLPSYLAYGVTSVFNLNGSPDLLDYRRRIAAGELLGPTIYTAGPTVDGVPPINTLFVGVSSTSAARRVVAEQKRAGYDFIKVYSNLDTLAYRAILDEAAGQRIAVLGHIPRRVGWRTVLTETDAIRQVDIAHVEEFFQRPIADSEFVEVTRLASAAARSDRGLWVTANLFTYSDYLRTVAQFPSLRGVLNDPEMRFAAPSLYSERLPANNRANRPDLEQFANGLRRQQERFRLLTRMLHGAGVPLLVGTDTEIFGFPGQSAQMELQELVASGLSPYEALRAATVQAGEFVSRQLPRAKPFGAVAVGQRADLVLLAGNPLDNIGNAERVRGVMLGGRWLPRTRLDAMRDSVARATRGIRPMIARFDSLVSVRKVDEAVATFRRMRRRFPSIVPVAEVVMRSYGQRLLAADPGGSMTIRRLATELFPRSFSAWGELARGDLARGDTTAAMAHFRRALALSPNDEWIGGQFAALHAR